MGGKNPPFQFQGPQRISGRKKVSKKNKKYGSGPHTAEKQERLRSALRLHAIYVRAVCQKWPKKFYYFIDTTCGPGLSPEGEDGSPLIIMEQMSRLSGIEPRAIFIDSDLGAIEALKYSLEKRYPRYWNQHVGLLNHDYAAVIPLLEIPKSTKGIIYVDRTGQIPDWEVFRKCRLDLLINVACTTLKRVRGQQAYFEAKGKVIEDPITPLDDAILSLRKEWLIQEPVGQHGWSMLFGFRNAPQSWKKQGWYRIDSERGKHLLMLATKSKEEQKSMKYPGELFD